MKPEPDCPFPANSTPADAEEAAYQALYLCEIDGDEHTTGAFLECLRIGSWPAPEGSAVLDDAGLEPE